MVNGTVRGTVKRNLNNFYAKTSKFWKMCKKNIDNSKRDMLKLTKELQKLLDFCKKNKKGEVKE